MQDWRNKANGADAYIECMKEFFWMPANFESRCDGYLIRISIAKHRVELSVHDSKSAQSAPYRSSPESREFEKAEINQSCCQRERQGRHRMKGKHR